MKAAHRKTEPTLRVDDATIVTPAGRVLFQHLDLETSGEHVAIVGRNGIGKSTLLEVLAGRVEHDRVTRTGSVGFVPQVVYGAARSHGEERRARLAAAIDAEPDFLLLDEPTDDLDEGAVAWLCAALRARKKNVIVASHDRRILEEFRYFVTIRERGCSLFTGTFDELLARLDDDWMAEQESYARALRRLADREEDMVAVANRKARKKRSGRCAELDRGTPRIRLNRKGSEAQVSHGKHAQMREARLGALREWTRSARGAMTARLGLDLEPARLPPFDGRPIVSLESVGMRAKDRALFEALDLHVGRDRIAVRGPNGAGKTTLLGLVTGEARPETGRAVVDRTRLGAIAQEGTNWMLETSLVEELGTNDPSLTTESIAGLVVAAKLPLGLAHRAMKSLSPGERVRAALLCLLSRRPVPELLVLDEPTFGLDLLGRNAIVAALSAWPGGLVVASHDRGFLYEVGVERTIVLGETSQLAGPHTSQYFSFA